MSKIKIGSDFSGVGAFPQALIRLGIEYDEVFACDMDRYARQTYCLNFGTEHDLKLASQSTIIQRTLLDEFSFDFPLDVYERKIPEESLDIYCTSPPCQAFSMAGKRMGKDDQRGILFFNSLEFIKENKPRYFIFENVKGLLSHDRQDKNAVYGRTFQEWINYLGGKSVNGVHTFFPYEDSVPYHIYFQVLNAKHYGIPQNRERVFIIGIRDDEDNNFHFPKPFPLEKRLKDVLETEVDEKYFLSDKMISYLDKAPRSIGFSDTEKKDSANCVLATYFKMPTDGEYLKIGAIRGRNPTNPIVEYQLTGGKWDKTHEQSGRVYDKEGISPTIHTMGGGNQEPKIAIGAFRGRKSTDIVKVARVGRSDEGKRLRKESLNRGKDYTPFQAKEITFEESDIMNCVTTSTTKDNLIQMLEINENRTSNALTTVQKDNVVVIQANTSKGFDEAEEEEDSINFSVPSSKTRRGRVGKKVSQTLDTQCNQGIFTKNLFNTDKNINFDGILKSIDNEKRNTAKVLLMLQQEIGKTAIETWGLRILEIIREKTLLQQRLYEESFYSKRKKSTRGTINKIQQTESIKINSYVIMRSLPKEGWERCSSQRRKSIKQLVRELNESLQKLSYENPQTNSDLQSGELQYENKGLRILREALSKIQEIWESINSETQPILRTQRIRRLTPTEAFRLMDFNDDMIEKTIGSGLISDSQLYKQAGNSICVGVLAAIISKLKF